MVGNAQSMLLVAVSSLLGGPSVAGSQNDSDMIELEIVDHTSLSILPCQEVTLLLRLTAPSLQSAKYWRERAAEVSQSVRVNDRVFRNRLPTTGQTKFYNDAAVFRLLQGEEASQAPVTRNSCLITIRLFVNARARTCLFERPGQYSVEVGNTGQQVQFVVSVNKPTAADSEVVEVINQLEVLLLLLDPTDPQYATTTRIEQLLPYASGGNRYSQMLAMPVGIGLMRAPILSEGNADTRRARWTQAFELLSQNCRETIHSDIEALGAYYGGLAASLLLRDETSEKQANLYREARRELWTRVAKSPFAVGEAKHAADLLAKVRQREP